MILPPNAITAKTSIGEWITLATNEVVIPLESTTSTNTQTEDTSDSTDTTLLVGASELYTTDKLQIIDNQIELDPAPTGGIVHNLALVFSSVDSTTIEKEVFCTLEDNIVKFDELDNVDGMYAILSYYVAQS